MLNMKYPSSICCPGQYPWYYKFSPKSLWLGKGLVKLAYQSCVADPPFFHRLVKIKLGTLIAIARSPKSRRFYYCPLTNIAWCFAWMPVTFLRKFCLSGTEVSLATAVNLIFFFGDWKPLLFRNQWIVAMFIFPTTSFKIRNWAGSLSFLKVYFKLSSLIVCFTTLPISWFRSQIAACKMSFPMVCLVRF